LFSENGKIAASFNERLLFEPEEHHFQLCDDAEVTHVASYPLFVPLTWCVSAGRGGVRMDATRAADGCRSGDGRSAGAIVGVRHAYVRVRAAQSDFTSSNSATLVWPVMGTMTPGDFTIILLPLT
jgi:hypothetical protein